MKSVTGSEHLLHGAQVSAGYVLRGGTAIDPRGGGVTSDADVVVGGGRVSAVTTGPAPGLPDDVPVVDVRGRFVVPGFEEMHAHPLEQDAPGCYELMVAHGISGFRQMSGSRDLLRRRTDGDLPLPEISPELRELPGSVMTPLNGGTEKQAALTVAEQHAAGADFIKSAMLTPETFAAAQAEARALGIPILGHLPAGVDVEAASRAGLRSIEHLGPGVPLLGRCSTHADHVRETAASGRSPRVPRIPGLTPLLERVAGPLIQRVLVNPSARMPGSEARLLDEALTSFDVTRAGRLAARFAGDGTWNVPTLIRMKSIYRCDEPEFTANDELRYVSPDALERWAASNARFATLPTSTRRTMRSVYSRLLELTAVLAQAGAPMLTGSDSCVAGWLVPGVRAAPRVRRAGRGGSATGDGAAHGHQRGRGVPGRTGADRDDRAGRQC